MIQKLQSYFNIPASNGFSGVNFRKNKYFSEDIKLKPVLQNDTVSFSGSNSFVKTGFPDLKQPNDDYCAPTSAASGVMSLNSPALQDENLIFTMGEYLKTDKRGTSADNLCKGLNNFFHDRGYNDFNIEYQGLRPVENCKTSNIPDFNKIKSEIEKPGFVLLFLNFYKKTGSGNDAKYIYKFGHCVNAIGYKNDTENGDNTTLIINDPYKKTQEPINLKTEKMIGGKLIHDNDDEEFLGDSAKGLYEVTGLPYLEKFSYPDNDWITLIEGAVFIETNTAKN